MLLPLNQCITDAVTYSHVRRFTFDGRYLVGFTEDQRSICVYRVLYPQRSTQEGLSFGTFFQPCSSMRIEGLLDGEVLCKDYLLMYTDATGVYFIVASAVPSPVGSKSQLQNPCSLPTGESLDDITLHLVRFSESTMMMEKTSQIHFKADHIFLVHHAGTALCEDRLAVLSVQHQVVSMYRIHDGRFISDGSIGYHPSKMSLSDMTTTWSSHGCFKQKLLICLYRQFKDKVSFHYCAMSLEKLLMWKCQFVERHMLLFKLLPALKPDPDHIFYALYDLEQDVVQNIWSYADPEFYEWLKLNDGALRRTAFGGAQGRSSSDCCHLQTALETQLAYAYKHKEPQLYRRVLQHIPYSSQSLQYCAYLDKSISSWDDRLISQELGRWTGFTKTLRFLDKQKHEVVCKIVSPNGHSNHRYSLIWHPSLPLLILCKQIPGLRLPNVDVYFYG